MGKVAETLQGNFQSINGDSAETSDSKSDIFCEKQLSAPVTRKAM